MTDNDAAGPKPHRRAVLTGSALAAIGVAGAACAQAGNGSNGALKAAILIDQNATLIDYTGIWQALANAPIGNVAGFEIYSVAPTLAPISSSNLQVTPNHTYETAPQPDVLIMGAQSGHNEAKYDWIRKVSAKTRITASVCTGAFLLAEAGLLDGLKATTHHNFYDRLEKNFPKVTVLRGQRIVDQGHIVTAGGEASCLDLGFWMIDKFYGRQAALAAADYTEYEGRRWIA